MLRQDPCGIQGSPGQRTPHSYWICTTAENSMRGQCKSKRVIKGKGEGNVNFPSFCFSLNSLKLCDAKPVL